MLNTEIPSMCLDFLLVTKGLIVDLLRYANFVVCYTESYPQQII